MFHAEVAAAPSVNIDSSDAELTVTGFVGAGHHEPLPALGARLGSVRSDGAFLAVDVSTRCNQPTITPCQRKGRTQSQPKQDFARRTNAISLMLGQTSKIRVTWDFRLVPTSQRCSQQDGMWRTTRFYSHSQSWVLDL